MIRYSDATQFSMTCKTFTNRSENELHPSALLQLQEQRCFAGCFSPLSRFSLLSKPTCKPNRLDTGHQEPGRVAVKDPSNFTDVSHALSKRPAVPPVRAPARLRAAPQHPPHTRGRALPPRPPHPAPTPQFPRRG